jgi:hypothetical protein
MLEYSSIFTRLVAQENVIVFLVLMTANMKMIVFWAVELHSIVETNISKVLNAPIIRAITLFHNSWH